MEDNLKFPTFECAISDTVESYDSDVEMYFMNSNLLSARLAELALSDRDFSGNYRKMMKYVSDLSGSVVSGKPHRRTSFSLICAWALRRSRIWANFFLKAGPRTLQRSSKPCSTCAS